MTTRTRIRAALKDDVTEVRVLMSHPMETGQRKDASGKPVPAHFVTDVTVKHNGKVILAAEFGPAVSRDPYLSFKFRGGARGDTVAVTWLDSRGESRTDEVTVS